MPKPAKAAAQPSPYLPDANDIVADMLAVVHEIWPELGPEKLAAAERQIRERWGGDRPYIAIRAGLGRSERNDAILRDHRAGERIPLLMRRYSLSRGRIYEIINSA
jgi:Mor family transcriptional regulator